MNKSINKCKILFLMMGTLSLNLLSGCGSSNSEEVMPITKTIYQRTSYDTAMVEKGDIEPVVTLNLSSDVIETIDYTVDEENLEVDEILVSVGQQVSAGQVLVTFKAEEIKKAIEKYSSAVEKNQLLLDHYTRLANVEKKKDYKVEIEKLTDDVALSKLFLEEEIERMNQCTIVASKDGTISYLSKVLLNGYVAPSTCMVTEVCGQGTYTAETSDDYNYQIGDVFTAKNDMTECEMTITDIQNAENEENKNLKKIVFKPNSSLTDAIGQDFTIEINKGVLKNTVYVNALAIQNKGDINFVYVVSEDGFLDVVYVELGEQVDDLVVIKSGLSGGEEVLLK